GMLSFAANHYLTGMDPYWFKLTNLCIHLLNGLLVFLALRALFSFRHAVRDSSQPRVQFDAGWAAVALASLWLVLPINLTGVLYISQRLESLSNTFVFLGLWWYLRARLALWQGRSGVIGLWLALLVGTGIGVLVKESAVLLPLYAFSVELALTGFRQRDGRWSKPVLGLYAGLLVVPLVVGLYWLAGWVDGTRSYGRAFDIPQRLMTEARILFEYMHWTLVPNLDSLTLYHDDIQVSRGLLSPLTTLWSLLGIVLLLCVAVWKRKSMPLFSLGIFWFFGGHVLTATVIPLVLAFEHRNYFPSLGLLLACTSVFAMEGLRLRARTCVLVFIAAFCFLAFTTALRAVEWSDPTRLALSEAAKRPQSPGAQFARANLLLSGLQRRDGRSLVEDAFLGLDSARMLPDAGMLFEQLLIRAHAQRRLPVRQEWWDDIASKLEKRPATASDARALHNLNACFIDHICTGDIAPLKRAYDAALSHGAPRPELLSVHAEFAWHLMGDQQQGEKDIRAAVQASPKDIGARKNLIILLTATKQFADAETELRLLRQQNLFGLFDDMIESLDTTLKLQKAGTNSGKHAGDPLGPSGKQE
ncbi:MAG: hypothetical protein IT476_08570, partial [Rhodanobacteraceae bacterium]|nr:hypothetical protein [Rhodanobacteraceae bacterium]